MDESEVWARARDGDGAAFGELFDAHVQRVHRLSARLVDGQHDAEDVTAGAFLELWRRRRSVRVVGGSVLPWLLVTTTNIARNRVRSLRRYRAALDRLPRQPVFFEVDPRHDDLVDALALLDPLDGHLLCLVAIEGYRVKDAAELLGLTETAARSRLHRARHRARARLVATPVEER